MKVDCEGITNKLREAWTNSLIQLHLNVDFAFIGDSLTYWGCFDKILSPKTVCNLGLRGDDLDGIQKRVSQLIAISPTITFIMIGLNDLPLHIDCFREKYNDFLAVIKASLPESHIIIQSILPVNDIDYSISCTNKDIDEANLIIAELALKYKYDYWDLNSLYKNNEQLLNEFTSDGIHLTDYGYQIWYKQLSSYFKTI